MQPSPTLVTQAHALLTTMWPPAFALSSADASQTTMHCHESSRMHTRPQIDCAGNMKLLQEYLPVQFEKDTLGTSLVALGLFCPTFPTGVPRDPVLPQNWFPLRLLHRQKPPSATL